MSKKKDSPMTKEKLLERIKQLEAERANLIQNIAAYDGAIQDCKWWLEQMENVSE